MSRLLRFIALSIAALAMLAACSPATSPSPTQGKSTAAQERLATAQPQQTTSTPESLEGAVLADGSSTVGPITMAAAEEFQKLYPKVHVAVGISGTGGGFKKFCPAETEINDASRPIKASEVEVCQANNVEFIELPVAFDGIAVVVNPQNDFVSCLTVEELRKIWGPEAEGTITNWNQVRPDFPDLPLTLYGPGVDSGTFEYFTEAIIGEAGASRGDFLASEDDNVLVRGVAGDRGALGYFGLAYYEENKDSLKLVAIDNGQGCVLPSFESVADGTYQPLSRPLFIYVNRARADDNKALDRFVEFYLQNAKHLAPEVGYISLPDEIYELALQRYQKRITGSVFEGAGAQVGVTLRELLEKEQ